jgi:hypothetical protein
MKRSDQPRRGADRILGRIAFRRTPVNATRCTARNGRTRRVRVSLAPWSTSESRCEPRLRGGVQRSVPPRPAVTDWCLIGLGGTTQPRHHMRRSQRALTAPIAAPGPAMPSPPPPLRRVSPQRRNGFSPLRTAGSPAARNASTRTRRAARTRLATRPRGTPRGRLHARGALPRSRSARPSSSSRQLWRGRRLGAAEPVGLPTDDRHHQQNRLSDGRWPPPAKHRDSAAPAEHPQREGEAPTRPVGEEPEVVRPAVTARPRSENGEHCGHRHRYGDRNRKNRLPTYRSPRPV